MADKLLKKKLSKQSATETGGPGRGNHEYGDGPDCVHCGAFGPIDDYDPCTEERERSAPEWDPKSGVRERLALLVALLSYYGDELQVRLSVPGYAYVPEHDRWDHLAPTVAGPVCVKVVAEAPVQLDRLRKLGVGYHEAMRLAGIEEMETET